MARYSSYEHGRVSVKNLGRYKFHVSTDSITYQIKDGMMMALRKRSHNTFSYCKLQVFAQLYQLGKYVTTLNLLLIRHNMNSPTTQHLESLHEPFVLKVCLFATLQYLVGELLIVRKNMKTDLD